MLFDIFVTLKFVDGRLVEVPNQHNPVESANIQSALQQLAGSLPTLNFGLEYVGIRIERKSE